MSANKIRSKTEVRAGRSRFWLIPFLIAAMLFLCAGTGFAQWNNGNNQQGNNQQGQNYSSDLGNTAANLDGTGIGVAVIDSGVSPHNDLMKASGKGSRIVYSESFVPGDPSTADAFGHGTHVAGIIAGNGHDSLYTRQPYIGIAPNANIIN